MSDSLFREEVLAARSSQWAGKIVLARPVPMRIAAGTAAVLVLALGLYLGLGEYTRKVRVSGQILPADGAIKVVASQFGRIAMRHVKEGDSVAMGQVLFELSNERMGTDSGADARIDASLAVRRAHMLQSGQLQAQQLDQRGRALEEKQRSLDASIAQLSTLATLQDELVRNAQATLASYKLLERKGFYSVEKLRLVKGDLLAQQAKRVEIAGSLIAARREQQQVRQEGQESDAQRKLAESLSAQNLAALDQEAAEHSGRTRLQIVAPAAGVVTALALDRGQSVQVGTALATILPTGSELQAQLMVPPRAVGFIQPGQAVLLRLSAFAYQKFGQVRGTVTLVERSPIGEVGGGGAVPEPMYRVTVKLARQSLRVYGHEQRFMAGMTFDADILQDRRRLIEWVLDPLVSATQGGAP